MTQHKYAAKYEKETMAKAVGRALPISTRFSIEICKWIRGRKLTTAKKMLNEVIAMKRAVPITKFNHGVSHQTGIGPGRFPVKACAEILGVLESAEVNAQFKGIDVNGLRIKHISANKAHSPMHQGRQGRRKMKRTHVEVMLAPESDTKPQQKGKKEKEGDK